VQAKHSSFLGCLTPASDSAYLSRDLLRAECKNHLFILRKTLMYRSLPMLYHGVVQTCAAFVLLMTPALVAELPRSDSIASQTAVDWHDEYHGGLDDAQCQRKLALVWFYPAATADHSNSPSDALFTRPSIAAAINARYVPIKLPTTAMIPSAGEKTVLLDHPAFAELHRSPGLAIIDMSDEQSPLFRQVVSIYPLTRGPISPEKLSVLLDLPRGTLTQRTLIFAVRTHPERPASASGHFSQVLAREGENHSLHQASLALQGHHNWESRFHAINAQLPGGLAAREVCAESWPGQNLLDAADECVHSWRQSSGHWQAVGSRHRLFAFDMKLGTNGIWYATGLFAD